MLGQLIKYEMKAIVRILIPVYIGLFVLTVWSKIMLSFSANNAPKSLTAVISAISVFIYVLMIFATEIITCIIIINRFYKSVLCDEGYLTNTLPVRSETIIVSKMLAAFLWIVISAVVIYISCRVLAGNRQEAINTNVKLSMDSAGLFNIATGDTEAKIGIIISASLCVLSQILHVYASMCLGQLCSKHKVLASFAIFIGFSIVFSIINTIIMVEFLFRLSPGTDFSVLGDNSMMVRSIEYVVEGIIYFFIARYVLTKRLNLE